MTRMTKTRPDDRLLRLIEAARLQRDMHLTHLAATASKVAATRAKHAATEPAPVESADPAIHVAALRHTLWAEQRRNTLLAALHRQEAALVSQRAEAARALARHDMLTTLVRKRRDQLS